MARQLTTDENLDALGFQIAVLQVSVVAMLRRVRKTDPTLGPDLRRMFEQMKATLNASSVSDAAIKIAHNTMDSALKAMDDDGTG